MSYVDWEIKGPSINACNCDWGCPCQFNALPTHGDCRAAFATEIQQGHFGDTSLVGLRCVSLYAWPRAVHQGNGEVAMIVDEAADAAQREGLLKILSGEETEPGATIFNVFATTYTKVHDPIFAPIEFEIDLETRRGRFAVPGVLEAHTRAITNPVTGAEHRAKVTLPHGFEYSEAEYCSSEIKGGAPIAQEWAGRHGHMYILHMTPQGPVRRES